MADTWGTDPEAVAAMDRFLRNTSAVQALESFMANPNDVVTRTV